MALSTFDASKPLAVGIPGCGGHLCDKRGGFCGGGGFAFSWTAMEKLMTPNATAFQQDREKTVHCFKT